MSDTPELEPEINEQIPDTFDVPEETVARVNANTKPVQSNTNVTAGSGQKPSPVLGTSGATNQDTKFNAGSFRSFFSRNDDDSQTPKDKAKDALRDKAKDTVKKETAELAKQARNQVAKQAERVAVQLGARAAAFFAGATAEVWVPVVAVIIVIGLLIIAIAASAGIGSTGITGSTIHASSNTNTQSLTLANAGDILSRRALDATDIQQIKTLLQAVKTQAQKKTPADTESIALIDSMITKLDTYSSDDSKVNQTAITEIQTGLQQLSAKGYDGVAASDLGQQIAKLARYYADDPSGKQKYANCSVQDKTACNSFVIKIMHETNADPNYEGRAYDQYLYTKSNTACYESFTITSTSQLAQGDIVFRPRLSANGYGHVAIYVGNGQIAAASIDDHEPRVRNWYSDLSAGARLKGGPCKKS